MNDKKQKIIGRMSLLAATVIWGSSFVVLKNTLEVVSTFYILAMRFTGAAVITLFVGIKDMKRPELDCLKYGALMGLCLFFAYVLQTFGLVYTTPGKNAFLTATYCVMVPFLNWLVYRGRPDRYNVAAALVCIAGMGLVSLQGDFTIGLGEGLTSACGLFYAMHIVVTATAVKKHNVIQLSMIQFVVVAVLSWPCALLSGPLPSGAPSDAWLSIAYLCVMCTAASMMLQALGQKYTPPSAAAVLLTFESVFGAAISVLFYDEKLTPRLIFGFVLIFCAVLISETKLAFLRKVKTVGTAEYLE